MAATLRETNPTNVGSYNAYTPAIRTSPLCEGHLAVTFRVATSGNRLAVVIATIAMALVGSDPAVAQETRAAAIRQEQANKQRIVTPPQKSRGEAIVERLERWGIISGAPSGLY